MSTFNIHTYKQRLQDNLELLKTLLSNKVISLEEYSFSVYPIEYQLEYLSDI